MDQERVESYKAGHCAGRCQKGRKRAVKRRKGRSREEQDRPLVTRRGVKPVDQEWTSGGPGTKDDRVISLPLLKLLLLLILLTQLPV